jgi:hypothetical protein
MSNIKRIVSYKLKMEIEWEDGKVEEIDFPEHMAEYIDSYLTEIEEERAEEEENEII